MTASGPAGDGQDGALLHICGDRDLTGTSIPGSCGFCGGDLVYEPAGVAPGSVLTCSTCALDMMGFRSI